MRTRPCGSYLLLTTIIGIPVGADAQALTVPAWHYTAPDTITRYDVTPLGTLAVLTDSGLAVLDALTGQVRWTRADVGEFRVINFTTAIVLYTSQGSEFADLETGLTRWSVGSLPLARVRNYHPLVQRDALLVSGDADETSIILRVSMESGQVMWRQDTLGSVQRRRWGGALDQPPVHDTDSTLVVLPKVGGPARLHVESGALLWRADTVAGLRPGAIEDGYAPVYVAGGKVFVAYERRLFALDAQTGRFLWDRGDFKEGFIAQMELTAHGLLVRGSPRFGEHAGFWRNTEPFLDLLDPENGHSFWARPLDRLVFSTSFEVRGGTAYIAARGGLLAIDLGSGSAREVARIRFRGGEKPERLESSDRGFLLQSSQNLILLNTHGSQQYYVYYPAPGPSLLGVLFSTPMLASLSLGAATQGAGTSLPWLYSPFLRQRTSTNGVTYAYLFTSARDSLGHGGYSLVRVDKADGREMGRVPIDELEPDYKVDPLRSMVYRKRHGREIVALGF